MTDQKPKRIASQLARVLPEETLGEFKLAPELLAEEEAEPELSAERHELIFDASNQIAIQKRLSGSYSDWHTWEHLRNFEEGETASKAVSSEALQHFQNCFYMASDCSELLRSYLRSRADLSQYESCVMLATNRWTQRATSARQYHCIMMLPLPKACIIIDPVVSSYAIRVPVNTIWDTGFNKFCYAALDDVRFLVNIGQDQTPMLTHPETGEELGHGDPFRSIVDGFEGGIKNLAYPSDNYRGRTPSNRCIFMYDVWDTQPTSDIDYTLLGADSGKEGKFVVETGRISFSFTEHRIWIMSMPVEWLHDPKKADLLNRLQKRKQFIIEGILAGFTVDMHMYADVQQGFLKRTRENLELLQELVEALGLQEGELMRIANIMLGHWQEEDRAKPKKVLKRKR